MIDAVAKAIMLWAVPYNDWDAISEEQRERWRKAALAAVAAYLGITMDQAMDDIRALAARSRASYTPADG